MFTYLHSATIAIISTQAYLYSTLWVMYARRLHRISPPARQGHYDFETALHCQLTLHEYLTPFLTFLALTAWVFHDLYAAVIGLLYLMGNIFFIAGCFFHRQLVRQSGLILMLFAIVVLMLSCTRILLQQAHL